MQPSININRVPDRTRHPWPDDDAPMRADGELRIRSERDLDFARGDPELPDHGTLGCEIQHRARQDRASPSRDTVGDGDCLVCYDGVGERYVYFDTGLR